MAEFHFLRPWWLLILPCALWAAWRLGLGRGGRDGWRGVVDRWLQPFVLADGESLSRRRWPVAVGLAAAVIASLALAGPAWDRLEVPAYRSDEALVVALDLSRSMNAADVEPTRLVRARLKLIDLLERRGSGQTGLVVFTANAFTVTPLTNDTRTISSLVNALETDIMPSQGSLLEVGLDKAAALLEQSGVSRGDILLITDAVATPAAFARAEALAAGGISVSVLGVGTEEGAPIPDLAGGFVSDAGGRVVVPQLDPDNLNRLAAAGGGRFSRLAADDSDLDRLFPEDVVGGVIADGEDGERAAEIWRDQGIWLAVLLLPLVALGFRRGWIYVVVAGVMLPLPRAEAFEWRDLWQRPDQQGAAVFEDGAAADAAELFEDPEWSAAARYRAGQYEASAAALAGIDSPAANYNRGNALARAGRLAEAIAAYDRTLELEPGHADAEYNRELVAELLEQQQEEQQQGGGGEEQAEGQQSGERQAANEQSGEGESGAEDAGGQQAESGGEDGSGQPEARGAERAQSAADASGQDPSSSPGERPATADERADETGPPDSPGETGEEPVPGEEAQQAAASPDDVEDWASEQAAEQWLRRIPQDPGGLLRRKFRYQYQQYGVDQDGNTIYPGSAAEPW